MNLYTVISGLAVATLLFSSTSHLQAQTRRPNQLRRPPGISSLGEKRCENIDFQGPDYANFRVRYIPMNRDIFFGNTAVRAIAYFGTESWLAGRGGFGKGSSITLVCQLAQSNQTPKYRNLRLYFGFNALDERNSSYRDAVLKFSIYKDGEDYPVMSDFLRMGDRLRWNVNVAGVQRIRLEGQCLGHSYACPGLYFFQDILQ